jgi:hypothetical protein
MFLVLLCISVPSFMINLASNSVAASREGLVRKQYFGLKFMKSIRKTFAIALALGAPIASFAQPSDQPQDSQATQKIAADSSEIGLSDHHLLQASNSSEITISSYSPPIFNVC